MKHTAIYLTTILLLPFWTFGQRNVIGEYSTIHKYYLGSGLELTLNFDSTFTMSNYELKSDTPMIFKTVIGHWTTKDSTKWLLLHQIINDTLQLLYEFPFIASDKLLSMTCKDSSKTKSTIDAYALSYYPMVFYKVKGFYPSKQLESVLPRTTSDNFDDCPPTGIWKFYYQNGILKEEIDFTDFKNEKGAVIKKEYFESGKIKSIKQWNDGLKEGDWNEYDESGNITKSLIYKKDKLKN
jgi:hypothetical protein